MLVWNYNHFVSFIKSGQNEWHTVDIFGKCKWRGSRIPWSLKYKHLHTILEWFAPLSKCWNRKKHMDFLTTHNNRSGQRTELCTALSPTKLKGRCTRSGQIYITSFAENFLWSAAVGVSKTEVASKNSWWVFCFSKFAYMELRTHQNLFALILVQIWAFTCSVIENSRVGLKHH